MKINRLKLVNFKGIERGLSTNCIEIDFTKTDKQLIFLLGENGSGKSTIMSCLTPFSETFDNRSSLAIEGGVATKEIDIQVNEYLYKIIHRYEPRKNKSFITRIDLNTGEETILNPQGNVSAFPAIIEEELGITKEFFMLSRIGSQANNFIDLNTSERKKFIGNLTPSIEPYLALGKPVTEKLTSINREIKFCSDELGKYNQEEIERELASLSLTENTLHQSMSRVVEERSKLVADFGEFDVDKARIIIKEYLNNSDLKYALKQKSNKFDMMKIDTININNTIKTIEDLTEKKASLQSDLNVIMYKYNDIKIKGKELEGKLKHDHKDIADLEKFNSKYNQELEENLAYKKDLESKYGSLDHIEEKLQDVQVLARMSSNLDLIRHIDMEVRGEDNPVRGEYFGEILDRDEEDLASLERSLMYATGSKDLVIQLNTLLDTYQGDNTTDFYVAVSTLVGNIPLSEDSVTQLQEEIKSLKESVNTSYKLIKEDEKLVKIITDIKNKYLLTDKDIKSLNNIGLKVKSLSDLITLVQEDALNPTEYALNKTVELNNAKKLFDECNTDIALIERNINDSVKLLNETITIINDNQIINEQIDKLAVEFDSTKKEIHTIQDEIKRIENEIGLNKELKEYREAYDENLKEIERFALILESKKEGYDKATSQMAEYENFTAKLNQFNREYDDLNNSLKSVQDTIIELKSKLKLVDSYNERIGAVVEDKAKLEIIKDSIDIRTGIPLILVGDYLSSIKNTANQLLEMAFGDKFNIEFNISDKEFSIPVLSGGREVASDVTLCSQGEVSLVKTALSLAIIIKAIEGASNKYNIVYLDEIDSELDKSKKTIFIEIINQLLSRLRSEQCFVITHNDNFDTAPAGLVLLSESAFDIDNVSLINNKDILWKNF